MATSPTTLVPRHRFGRLLRARREELGLATLDLAARSDGRYEARRLDGIERGVVALDDAEIDELCGLYGVARGALVPARTDLIIDLDDRILQVGERRSRIVPEDPDGLLQRYVALVYRLRGVEIGNIVSFRREDVLTLAVAFDTVEDDIEQRLGLILDQPEAIRRHHGRIRNRLVVPAAGILVAATGLGSLVMVRSEPAAASEAEGHDASPAVTDIGDAVVLTRGPDGAPGSQVVRTG